MRRSELKRTTGLSSRGKGGACPPKPSGAERNGICTPSKPKRRRERTRGKGGWRNKVFEMHGDRCLRCGVQADVGHHVVEKSRLFLELGHDCSQAILSDPRNGFPTCNSCHMGHHNWSGHDTPFRFTRELLPASVFVFAAELDEKYGTRFQVWIDRTYPGVQA